MRPSLKTLTLLLVFHSATSALAQFRTTLPDWAESALAQAGQPPADADMWRLLDETLMLPDRAGRVLVQRRVVQQVFTEAGIERAATFAVDNRLQASKQHRVQGWHRAGNGGVAKLERDKIWSLSLANDNQFSHQAVTTARFDRVGQGSVVVFESTETRDSMFAHDLILVPRDFPIAKRVVDIRLPGAALVAVNFTEWSVDSTLQGGRITIHNTPAMREEPMSSDDLFALPYLSVRYQDGDNDAAPLNDWAAFGRWYNRRFRAAAALPDAGKPLDALARLTATLDRQQQTVSYRQRYLSPHRGWLPAAGSLVAKRKYGDCKDMTACLAFLAGEQQISVQPTLARVHRDVNPGPDTPVSPFAFNHLIAAVPLQQSLGLPAEVLVDDQPYLLVDPTAKGTAPGYLPAEYRGRRVLVCLAQAGHWVAVPEKALEPAAVRVTVIARLDALFTLGGTMVITSRGNALGLRYTLGDHHSDRVERLIRKGLNLPSFAELTLVAVDRTDPSQVTTTCQVSWPSFLRHDDDGYRLPHCIVPTGYTALNEPGPPRQQPIRIPSQTPITWDLSLQAPRALTPGQTTAAWRDATRSFAWQASGGLTLSITYQQQGQSRLFTRDSLQAGIDDWENFRNNYIPFFLTATLFHEVRPANDHSGGAP